MGGIDDAVGARIAKGRRRRGWTQRDLSLAVGRSESWVSQVERGVLALDSVDTAEAVARALGLGVGHILAFDVRYPAAPAEEPPARLPGKTGTEGAARVERRVFVGSLASGLAGAFGALIPDTERTEHAVRTGSVDAATVEQLRTVAVAHRNSYRQVPATSLLPVAHAQINLLLSLQPGRQRAPLRRALLVQLGQMTALAAVVSYLDLGNRLDGDMYLALADQVARTVSDPELSALLLAGRAFHTSYAGDPEGGLDCALAAIDHAEAGASRRMCAWVYAVASEMHASTGDEVACRNAIETARYWLDGPLDDERWGGIGWFDLGKVDAYEGGDLVPARPPRAGSADPGCRLGAARAEHAPAPGHSPRRSGRRSCRRRTPRGCRR
ncbi:helix-turn-helix domain-containing protein [Streptomyces sp. QTS52]